MTVPLVTIIDRPSWYVPTIERDILAPYGIEVELGRTGDSAHPAKAPAADDALLMSRISAAATPRNELAPDTLVGMAHRSAGILVVGALVTREVIERLPLLKVIGRYGIGLDNIDLEAAERNGVAVVSAPGFCAAEVADHTMMFILAASRRLMALHGGMTDGRWLRASASPMPALAGQTLGLVGFGEIGQLVARRAGAFGLKVLAHDPLRADADFRNAGVQRVTLEQLLVSSDWVSLHVPMTAATKHMIGVRELATMKPTAVLLNTGRGALVEEAALVGALDAGRLGGAALDVFEAEPLSAAHPLLGRPNVLLTPHIAGLSDESQERCRRIVAQGIANVLAGS